QWVLQLAEMCRRLETKEEKVLPFYLSSLADEEQRDAQQVLQEPPAEPLAQVLWDYAGLERFWQRVNKVTLEEQVLLQKREALREGNRWLQERLQQYLAGISMNQEVPSHPSPV
ncbi:DRC2 protein, partial [Rhinopomastus cyanomelas]|nr:DRC2 protein [Rhinopomastus cyanomelas]